MTDRDRLIELSDEKIRTMRFRNSDHWFDFTEKVKEVIDYLLVNGVILPPCKVRDTVWCVWRTHELEIEQRCYINQSAVIGFTFDQGVTKPITGDYWYHGTFLGNHLVSVCFSPEDAEKKLKERENNDR